MTWLYQHHDYGNIEGFNSGDSGSSEPNVTEEIPSVTIVRIREFISNSKWLVLYFIIFLVFIFLGGPWLFYYFLLVGNNYFPMYLNYRTDVVPRGEDVIADTPDLVKIKDLYSKCYGEQSGSIGKVDKNLNVCYLNMGNSVPESKKGAGDGIPSPKVKMSLNMKAYYKLYPTPVGGYGDNKVSNNINSQNFFSRCFLNFLSYTLSWYFKLTYIISNIPAIVYIILFVSLIATISLMSDFSAGSIAKHLMIISGGGVSYLLFTILAAVCGLFACCAPLYRFNPDNILQDVKSLNKDDAYVFIFNFISVFNPNRDLGPTILCICSIFWRFLLMFLCALITSLCSLIMSPLGIGVIFYFMTRQTGVYYIKNKEYPLNLLNATYLFASYISTCRGFMECLCLVFILFAFLVETRNTTYNGFGIIVLLGTLIFWCCFRIFGSNTIRYKFLRHLHTEPDEPDEYDVYQNNETFNEENPMNKTRNNLDVASQKSNESITNEPDTTIDLGKEFNESFNAKPSGEPVREPVSEPVRESVSEPVSESVSEPPASNSTENDSSKTEK